MKKRILCFGDSLTWGYNPDTGMRFDDEDRWTGVLAQIFKDEYTVIEEGQNGRTIATDDPAEGEKCGIKYLIPCLESQSPLDYVIVMLGTNDLKRKFAYSSMDIAGEMEIFLQKLIAFNHFRMNDKIQIILISPPYIGEKINDSWLGDSFGYQNAYKVSRELAVWYKKLADMYKISFLDAAKYVHVSDTDSIHMDANNQQILGKKVSELIKSIKQSENEL